MKAMILAAGLGTRLRPLTDNIPKALVEINDRTLLEITLERLKTFAVTEVIVNVHHHADKIVEYLKSKNNFGMKIAISREDDLLLDTGGGLKKAAWFFLERNQPDEPFLLHNVDVLSDIDLRRMVEAHKEKRALVTLAVQERNSSRQLLFDENGFLSGRRKSDAPDEIVRPSSNLRPLAFSGIHVISPGFLSLLAESGVFSIIDSYLRIAGTGENISAFRADEYYWRDLGRPEDLQEAADDFAHHRIK